MRKLLVAALLFTSLLNAQSAQGAEWLTSYDQALSQAKTQNKPILADFTGSDWCGWCIRLDKEVFGTQQFEAWAQQNVILLKIDFPRSTPQEAALQKQNQALAQKYNIKGFPTILVLNTDGSIKAKTGYLRGGVGPYLTNLDSLIK